MAPLMFRDLIVSCCEGGEVVVQIFKAIASNNGENSTAREGETKELYHRSRNSWLLEMVD